MYLLYPNNTYYLYIHLSFSDFKLLQFLVCLLRIKRGQTFICTFVPVYNHFKSRVKNCNVIKIKCYWVDLNYQSNLKSEDILESCGFRKRIRLSADVSLETPSADMNEHPAVMFVCFTSFVSWPRWHSGVASRLVWFRRQIIFLQLIFFKKTM